MKKTISMIIMSVIMIALIPSNVRADDTDDMIISNQVVEDGFIEEIENMEVVPFSTTVNVNWTVNAKVLKRSKEFTKKAGEEIAINIRVSPAKKVQIGIIEGGKVKKSYQTTTGINRKIPITKKDTYAVFVQNMSGSQIKAKGSYQK